MINESVGWLLYQDLIKIPEKISLFLTQSLHCSLFQSPAWVACVEKQKTDTFVLCALKGNMPVFGALVRKSRIPGTKYYEASVTRGPVFEDIDVASNQNAVQEMVSKSGQMGVPVLDIDSNIVVGFDKGKIKQLLGL